MLGTGLRFAIDVALPHASDGFPVATVLINTTGALVLGLMVGWLWPRVSTWLRAGLGTGLLGSFTTFSAIAVSVVGLGNAGQWAGAALYLTLTLALGLTAAWGGLALGRRLGHEHGRGEGER